MCSDVCRLGVGGKVQRGRALGDQQADSGGSCHVAAQKNPLMDSAKIKALFWVLGAQKTLYSFLNYI
jgi:hypothetical protein